MLERHANDSKGKWRLVKLNIDKFPQLATQLEIKTIPTIFLISNKNSIDGFVGTPSEQTLASFFKSVEKVAGISETSQVIVEENVILASNLLESDETIEEGVKLV